MILIFPINPVPASRPRVTRWSTFYPKKYTRFKEDMEVLTSKLNFIPFKELVRADISFEIEMPKSWSKKKKNGLKGQYCNNNADIDNYLKALFDSLNGIVFVDDRQVVEVTASKKWAECGTIRVEIKDINEY